MMDWTQVEIADCWTWMGYVGPKGYGELGVGRSRRVHRRVWTELVGPISPGLTLDHLCRNRRCVNPDHLQPVPAGVNTLRGYGPAALNARKTRCLRGHQRWNTDTFGKRYCMDCR